MEHFPFQSLRRVGTCGVGRSWLLELNLRRRPHVFIPLPSVRRSVAAHATVHPPRHSSRCSHAACSADSGACSDCRAAKWSATAKRAAVRNMTRGSSSLIQNAETSTRRHPEKTSDRSVFLFLPWWRQISLCRLFDEVQIQTAKKLHTFRNCSGVESRSFDSNVERFCDTENKMNLFSSLLV